MKMTLLDAVQSILSSLSSDEVNSIGDTTESMQVAQIIKETYMNIAGRTHLPEHDDIFQLDASTDDTLPVLMYKPETVVNMHWVKYFDESVPHYDTSGYVHDLNTDITQTPTVDNPSLMYKDINILPISDFLAMVNEFNIYEDDVEEYEINKIKLRYKKLQQPQYCAVLSDYMVLFDAYDSTLENTLQTSKTQCYGQISPIFKMEDNFIIPIDEFQLPLLINEAKSLAFFELKQQLHQKAEQESKRQWSSVQRDKAMHQSPSYFDALPNFGRRWQGNSIWGSRYN